MEINKKRPTYKTQLTPHHSSEIRQQQKPFLPNLTTVKFETQLKLNQF